MQHINRRDLVKIVGGAGIGVAATLISQSGVASAAITPTGMAAIPWPYKALDPEAAAQRATDGYYKAECMYGAFEAIAGAAAEQLGSPYKDFPFMMMKFGGGGINGWGTICGALSGGAAAIQLLSPKPPELIDALFVWYESTALPDFYPRGSKSLPRLYATLRSATGARSRANIPTHPKDPNAVER